MLTSQTGGYVFFLGGKDLEMEAIAELLRHSVPAERIHDRSLEWGAAASAYEHEIREVAGRGLVPVLVELNIDVPLPENAVIIDHHGDRAGAERPTSLEQVFWFLGRPPEEWTRRLALVAANDRGYVTEMASLGATVEEMQAVRAADRRAQGITAEEEQQAEAAVQHAERLMSGRLTLVRLPHERTAPAADRLEARLGGPGYENLLICCPSTVTFFGVGALVEALRAALPGGWWGGALPARGYWGGRRSCDEVLEVIARGLGGG